MAFLDPGDLSGRYHALCRGNPVTSHDDEAALQAWIDAHPVTRRPYNMPDPNAWKIKDTQAPAEPH